MSQSRAGGIGPVLKKIKKLIPERILPRHPVVPVVRLTGTIGAVTPLRPGLSLGAVAAALERAFAFDDAPAVAMIVNSPGGSPVQSHLIYLRVRALAEERRKPVFCFVEDVAASGGYMLALAGDEIIADASSIVGSIGVVSASFGFDRLMEKLGVERRVHTAGDKKMALDPFLPEKPDDVRRLKNLQRDVHEAFVDLVKERRGSVLNGTDRQLFSGEFWSGRKALELGLVDRLGDLRQVLRERYGENVRLKLVSGDRGLFPKRAGILGPIAPKRPAAGLAEEAIAVLEQRALWARFGL
ncbi:MAG: S49 family peptidase [Hyphomicrobiales bacterium]|nr:S49 family peptidase [Hyphomicrobiales bacterium]